MNFLGRLLNIDNLDSIDHWEPSVAAPWAQALKPWLVPAFLMLCVLSAVFYLRFQTRGRRPWRVTLAVMRAILLCLLLLFLADPVVILRLTHAPRPWFWILFDGTDSMAIEDEYPDTERQKLDTSVDLAHESAPQSADEKPKPSRNDYVKAWLKKRDENLVKKLSENYRLKAFRFDRTDGATELTSLRPGQSPGQL